MLKNKLLKIRLNMAAQQGHDISQADFAALLGVSRRAYVDWEANKTQPNAESIWRIINKLKIPYTELFLEDTSSDI